MGLDLIDLMCRIERRFSCETPHEGILGVPGRSKQDDLTAGELHDWVCEECRRQTVVVPFSSWNRIRLCLHEACGFPACRIRRSSYMIRDLGF